MSLRLSGLVFQLLFLFLLLSFQFLFLLQRVGLGDFMGLVVQAETVARNLIIANDV